MAQQTLPTTSDNSICVTVSKDKQASGRELNFMKVTRPKDVTVGISADGHIQICVNESCVFDCEGAERLVVYNDFNSET